MASDTPDPAREVLRERMTRQQLCDLSDMNCNAAHLFSRLSNFWEGTACTLAEESEYAHAQLAARTTQRDQAASERDALRAEVEKLRAAQVTAPVASAAQGANPDAHTPGPWIVEDTGTHLWIGPPRSDGSGKVADIVVSMDIAQFTPEARARAIANACLIAAAPDLRAAPGCGEKVREAVRLWVEQRRLYEDDDASLADWQAVNTKARRALDALTDADLAPDPVWAECVEACCECAAHWASASDGESCYASHNRAIRAGRAARAKGGA